MKIALVSRGGAIQKGGAERFTMSFCRTLIERGHQVTLFSGDHFENHIDDISVKFIKYRKWFSFLKILDFHWKVRKALKQDQYDLVYGLCQFFPADYFYAGGGVHKNWMVLSSPNPVMRFLRYLLSPVHCAVVWIENHLWSKGSKTITITNSNLVKEHIQNYYPHYPQEQIKVIYDGVDHSVFNLRLQQYRKTIREQFGIDENDRLLIHASNNWKRKGLKTILKSMLSLEKKVKLLVIGRGKIKWFKKLIHQLNQSNQRVFFAGVVGDIQKYYGAGDIFVLPTQYDPFAQVCREAMASGMPVITTALNGAKEIIDEGQNGYVLDSWDDHKQLTSFIKKMKDPQMLNQMKQSAVYRVKEFSWQKNVEEHLELFGF